MKLSGGVEWAVHCCVVLSRAEGPVPATRLAEFHGISRTYLAKHLQQLSRAGLVSSTEGRVGGYALTRPADAITLLDVVQAIDGREPAFRCTEIRQNGPLPASPQACRKACGVARAMHAAEQAWRDSLKAVTVADLAAGVEHDVGPDTFVRVREWLGS
ncbi:Rrf2 family transcriptional regulator [Nocardioides sp. Root1257]|uniref:RrF2 family transcriptional regulator n=1 Tax=unclassified Nocardioides TaxID=2615069 RepID=UPI0006F835D5|nr:MULTISPECIES: Rrf2 family transcriptional regulator [unclassified Nocardioides]KQW47967.1 Rrf2 family transcriptional regulator [Nocardioides sp. Root1257]KRC45219.1 Rrf2 family transcriptional regulator [Nocardioides sp. Root224]